MSFCTQRYCSLLQKPSFPQISSVVSGSRAKRTREFSVRTGAKIPVSGHFSENSMPLGSTI